MPDVALVVDDDAAVRRLVAATLKADGFYVIEAGDGEAALAALECAGAVQVVVSDICMRGLDGISFYEQAAEGNKDLAFVFITGYADHERLVSVPSEWPLITKPFVPQALTACVRRVMARRKKTTVPVD